MADQRSEYQQSLIPAHYGQTTTPTQRLPALKALTGLIVGGSLVVLSGLILTGTVIALTLATPLLVIFSPVLVPAAAAIFLLSAGFVSSGGFGVAALVVISWLYGYLTGKHPPGADELDSAREKLGMKAREMRERADQHNAPGTYTGTGAYAS